MNFDQSLFESNKKQVEITNDKTISQEDVLNAIKCRNSSHAESEKDEWFKNEKRALTLPIYIPRSDETEKNWRKIVADYNPEMDDVSVYRDLHADIHLYNAMLGLRDDIRNTGFDPNDQISIAGQKIPTLICVGTGNGELIGSMLRELRPYNLVVMVSEWHEFYSSFWHLDWRELYNYFMQDGRKIIVARISDVNEITGYLSGLSPIALDHAYVYKPAKSSECINSIAEALHGNAIQNLITYLGYTIDEYNMVYNTVMTLLKNPKVYQRPSGIISKKVVVCGSGPSLDENLDAIKVLEKDHIIIAGGSNYSTLRTHGIRVDALTIVERADETYDGYEHLKDTDSHVRLFMSSTCPSGMIDIFPNAAVFFRPALTPMAIFSDSSRQILNFEGPEAVNAGISLGLSFGPEQMVLFGVDLGTAIQGKDRSANAVHYSERSWSEKVEGNYVDKVYTNRAMKDSRSVIESAIRYHSASVWNCSNGILIDGAKSISSAEYIQNNASNISSSREEYDKWWDSLSIYSSDRVAAVWKSRQLRKQTFDLARKLIRLFDGNQPWFPEVVNEIDSLLNYSGKELPEQIPIRIFRSTIYKSVLTISQEFQIMRKATVEQQSEFGAAARARMSKIINQLERETYELFDWTESKVSRYI